MDEGVLDAAQEEHQSAGLTPDEAAVRLSDVFWVSPTEPEPDGRYNVIAEYLDPSYQRPVPHWGVDLRNPREAHRDQSDGYLTVRAPADGRVVYVGELGDGLDSHVANYGMVLEVPLPEPMPLDDRTVSLDTNLLDDMQAAPPRAHRATIEPAHHQDMLDQLHPETIAMLPAGSQIQTMYDYTLDVDNGHLPAGTRMISIQTQNPSDEIRQFIIPTPGGQIITSFSAIHSDKLYTELQGSMFVRFWHGQQPAGSNIQVGDTVQKGDHVLDMIPYTSLQGGASDGTHIDMGVMMVFGNDIPDFSSYGSHAELAERCFWSSWPPDISSNMTGYNYSYVGSDFVNCPFQNMLMPHMVNPNNVLNQATSYSELQELEHLSATQSQTSQAVREAVNLFTQGLAAAMGFDMRSAGSAPTTALTL